MCGYSINNIGDIFVTGGVVRLQAQDTKVSHPFMGNLLIIRPIQVLMD